MTWFVCRRRCSLAVVLSATSIIVACGGGGRGGISDMASLLALAATASAGRVARRLGTERRQLRIESRGAVACCGRSNLCQKW
jgi:hypothetical protein